MGIFQNNVRNLIQTACIENCRVSRGQVRTYQNIDKAQVHGIETGYHIELTHGFDWGINYNYTDARNKETDKFLPNRSRHLANMQLGWRYDEHFKVHLRGEYIGGQVIENSSVRYHVPAYTLWHLGFSGALNKNIDWQVNLANVMNERLAEKDLNYDYEEIGRTLYAGLNISF